VVDPRITDIDRRREARNISHRALCEAAGVHLTTWFYLRAGNWMPAGDTIERLERALGDLTTTLVAPSPSLIVAFIAAAEDLVLRQIGGDPRVITAAAEGKALRKPGKYARALQARRLRRFAIYLAAVELEIGNAAIARAIGVTRQQVQQARVAIETLCERPEIDALLERCRARLKSVGRNR
jgi:transcriptional regulator with XRE-family HTH domain